MSEPSNEVDYEAGLRLVPRLVTKGRLQDAVRWADHLCRHRPDDPRAHNQAGLVRQNRLVPEEAAIHFRRALLLLPDAGEVWANLGNASRQAENSDGALRCFRRAAACLPNVSSIRLGIGLELLAAGDYANGLVEYEHRSDRLKTLRKYAALGVHAWDREDPRARRLLVVTEQGAGDVVQFLRFIQPMAARGAEITVACPDPLERLVRSVSGVAATAPQWRRDAPVGFDGVEALLSLPLCLGIDPRSFVAPARYITPPVPRWRVPEEGQLRVGLCWTGNLHNPHNEVRRIPFENLGPILEVPSVRFYGLQIWAGKHAAGVESGLVDLTPHVEDFADTAAMVDQMDLIITVDTSIAHIAGALGKPVWTLLARVPDWRWGRSGEATPWYPSMRLFRQTRSGEWSGVVERVVEALRGVAADHAGGLPKGRFASSVSTG